MWCIWPGQKAEWSVFRTGAFLLPNIDLWIGYEADEEFICSISSPTKLFYNLLVFSTPRRYFTRCHFTKKWLRQGCHSAHVWSSCDGLVTFPCGLDLLLEFIIVYMSIHIPGWWWLEHDFHFHIFGMIIPPDFRAKPGVYPDFQPQTPTCTGSNPRSGNHRCTARPWSVEGTSSDSGCWRSPRATLPFSIAYRWLHLCIDGDL